MDTIKSNIRRSYNNAKESRNEMEVSPWKESQVNKVLGLLKDGAKVLDLGAGSGIMSRYFYDSCMDVTCIDLSKSMVELCQEKGYKAQIMDFYHLDFPSGTFDCIWSMNTLLHVPKSDIRIVLEQVKSVLHKKGIFYLGLYGGKSSEGIYKEDFYEPKRFFAFYTMEELKPILEEYFDVASSEEVLLSGHKGLNYLAFILTSKMGRN